MTVEPDAKEPLGRLPAARAMSETDAQGVPGEAGMPTEAGGGSFARPVARNLGANTPPPLTWNIFTLRFHDRAIEKVFAREAAEHSIHFARIFMGIGILGYSLFGILDVLLIQNPTVLIQISAIRFLLVVPVMIIAFVLTFSRRCQPHIEAILTVCFLVAGGGIVMMTLFAERPVNILYYAGVTVIVIYGASLTQLRFTYSVFILATLFAAYALATLVQNAIPWWALVNNLAFLGSAVLLCSFSKYVQEYFVRRAYANNLLLAAEKAEASRLHLEAEAASTAKSSFLAVMSHELRTPLNAVIGFSDIMRGEMFGPLGSEQYRQYSEDINQSGQHLLSIINDILDMSRAEMGKLTLEAETFDLAEVGDRVFRMLTPQAKDNKLTLDFSKTGETIRVEADERLIRQVMINLVSNAIKFTPEGGHVRLDLGLDGGGRPYFTVIDTGIGIPSEHIDAVLEPFVQLEGALAREHGGAGIGLPLSKKIMELHEGELTVKSTVGEGTCVQARLPASRALRAPQDAPYQEPLGLSAAS
ncbi:MAG: ATP-binding protein [Pseudomonadota bacterium]